MVTLKDTPWFVAADVCKALDLTNTATSVAVSVNPIDTNRVKIAGQRGLPTIVITEAGLNKLVMRSDKAQAKEFQDWVTGTVLPAIRKDGVPEGERLSLLKHSIGSRTSHPSTFRGLGRG